MVKRAHIRLAGSPIIRVSVPGVDVDAAQTHQFMLHEDFLYTQPYHIVWVPCPFAGNNDNQEMQATEWIGVPAVTADPIILTYMFTNTGAAMYPMAPSSSPRNNSSDLFPQLQRFGVGAQIADPWSASVHFWKTGRLSPVGATLVFMRRAV